MAKNCTFIAHTDKTMIFLSEPKVGFRTRLGFCPFLANTHFMSVAKLAHTATNDAIPDANNSLITSSQGGMKKR
jgi:hypothetical protein